MSAPGPHSGDLVQLEDVQGQHQQGRGPQSNFPEEYVGGREVLHRKREALGAMRGRQAWFKAQLLLLPLHTFYTLSFISLICKMGWTSLCAQGWL